MRIVGPRLLGMVPAMSTIEDVPTGSAAPADWPVRLRDLTVVVPTRNEQANVAPLVLALAGAGPEQVIVVDDSDDGTAEAFAEVAGARLAVIHREPRGRAGGLGGAVRSGFEACRTRYCAVMDGDLQHPPEALERMLARLREGADLVVASRYSREGAAVGLDGAWRRAASKATTSAAKVAFPRELAGVSDPMSGMFALDLRTFDVDAIRPEGFKVLLEILVRARPRRVGEVPYVFHERNAGESKAGIAEGLRYLRRLAQLRLAAHR